MNSKIHFFLSISALIILSTHNCLAHFGMVIPDKNIITQDNKHTQLTLAFSHPFENVGMDLEKPETFSVTAHGQSTDITDTLEPATFMEHSSWTTRFSFKRPGVYQFTMTPTPYWEPAEDVSIIHYTKTIIGAYGDDEGWASPQDDLPTEIIPLLRPFGNYAGNGFTGQVLLGGKPASGAEIEVEFYDQGNKLQSPSDYHVTQVVKADGNGVFNFTCPHPGWWGFAALNEADYTIKDPDGQEKGVEIGAVLWIYLDQFPGTEK